MPTRQYGNCGRVRVRILRWPFDDGVYYDEYVEFGQQGDPNATVYIPVEDGEFYAVEITIFERFHMGRFTHIRSRLYHPGQLKGALRLINESYTEDPRRPNRLARDIVQTIDQMDRCRRGGVDRRNVRFIIKGLTPGKILFLKVVQLFLTLV